MLPGIGQTQRLIGNISPRMKSAAFAITYGVAAALSIFATVFAVSGIGGIGPASPTMLWLLAISYALVLGLAISVCWRLFHSVRRPKTPSPGQSGRRLHLRFVWLFSAGAVTPALVVALFLGVTLSRGVDQWFSDSVRNVVEDAAAVGRAYLTIESESVRGEVLAMAGDLNRAKNGLQLDADAYQRYLGEQARFRYFSSARVLNRTGVLAAALPQKAPIGLPRASDFSAADESEMFLREGRSGIDTLIRLTAYEDAYLQVFRPYDADIIGRLTRWNQSTQDYRVAEQRRRRIQSIFVLSYIATAVLVLVGAMWIGLGGASRIAGPIGRLSAAARRVASGDLAARVPVSNDRDEIDTLAHAFNGMTAQLEEQHGDLVKARMEAEQRSQFTQAVLSGVSAGVIGIDRDQRVTVANRSAAALLGVATSQLEGRRLIDIAPEFYELLNALSPEESATYGLVLHRSEAAIHLQVRIGREPSGMGLVITFDDMTKLVAAQRVEAWKDVARRIAHEIKNPLTPIQLSAERLRRKFSKEIVSDPETFERCTQTILRQVSDIGRMVEEFSALARMPVPKPAAEDIGELLRAAAYSQSIAFEDIAFPVASASQEPIQAECDGRLLAQAYANVLKNAAESIEARRNQQGEPKLGRVETLLRVDQDALIIEVTDNGLGFPRHNREQLVEPYVTTRARGAGLGLAIVLRILEDHGGGLELGDSDELGGALVRLMLPIRPANTAQNVQQEQSHVV